jgi:hypothetical protein
MSVPIGAPQQRPANPAQSSGLESKLGLAVAGLGLVSYLCSFAGEATALSFDVLILLAAGLLGALPSLPKLGTPTLLMPVVAVLSVVGGLGVLRTVLASPGSVPTIVLVILAVGILQAAAGVAALLAQVGLISAQPKPAAAPYAAPPAWGAPPSAGFPQPGQYGGQPGGYGQPVPPGQYGQPGQPAQQTAFMSQPGQFGSFGQSGQFAQSGHAQPGQAGQGQPGQGQSGQGQSGQGQTGQQPQQGQSGQNQQSQPGTPPGGFGAQNPS